MTYIIRTARSEDAVQIISGLNLICQEGGAFYVTHFEPDQAWNAALYHSADSTEHYLGVAELNGQIVGCVNLFRPPANSLLRHTANLGLYVLPEFRRQRIGSRLLEAAIVWAKTRELEKICLEVFVNNLPAQRLYAKFNFSVEGRSIRQVKERGHYIDMFWMARFL